MEVEEETPDPEVEESNKTKLVIEETSQAS